MPVNLLSPHVYDDYCHTVDYYVMLLIEMAVTNILHLYFLLKYIHLLILNVPLYTGCM